jgi:hypothetical protein
MSELDQRIVVPIPRLLTSIDLFSLTERMYPLRSALRRIPNVPCGRRNPSLIVLERIAKALGVQLPKFLEAQLPASLISRQALHDSERTVESVWVFGLPLLGGYRQASQRPSRVRQAATADTTSNISPFHFRQ